MTRRRRYVDSPVAGAADITRPAFFEGLICANLVAQIMHMIGGRLKLVFKRVDQTLIIKISLFDGHPFMQAHMRGNDEIPVHVGLQTSAACYGSIVTQGLESVT